MQKCRSKRDMNSPVIGLLTLVILPEFADLIPRCQQNPTFTPCCSVSLDQPKIFGQLPIFLELKAASPLFVDKPNYPYLRPQANGPAVEHQNHNDWSKVNEITSPCVLAIGFICSWSTLYTMPVYSLHCRLYIHCTVYTVRTLQHLRVTDVRPTHPPLAYTDLHFLQFNDFAPQHGEFSYSSQQSMKERLNSDTILCTIQSN